MAKCGKFGNFLWQNLAIFVAKFGKIWDFKWQFSAMPGILRLSKTLGEMNFRNTRLGMQVKVYVIVEVPFN